jgi:hypothetical protein
MGRHLATETRPPAVAAAVHHFHPPPRQAMWSQNGHTHRLLWRPRIRGHRTGHLYTLQYRCMLRYAAHEIQASPRRRLQPTVSSYFPQKHTTCPNSCPSDILQQSIRFRLHAHGMGVRDGTDGPNLGFEIKKQQQKQLSLLEYNACQTVCPCERTTFWGKRCIISIHTHTHPQRTRARTHARLIFGNVKNKEHATRADGGVFAHFGCPGSACTSFGPREHFLLYLFPSVSNANLDNPRN